MLFYFGLGLQLIGFTMVGLCFFAGLTKGEYGQIELIQLLSGSAIFYLGNYFRGKNQC